MYFFRFVIAKRMILYPAIDCALYHTCSYNFGLYNAVLIARSYPYKRSSIYSVALISYGPYGCYKPLIISLAYFRTGLQENNLIL